MTLLRAVALGGVVGQNFRQPFQSLPFPLGHLGGVNPVLRRELIDGLVPGNSLAGHPGLELPSITLPLCHDSLLLPLPSYHSHTILCPGPKNREYYNSPVLLE